MRMQRSRVLSNYIKKKTFGSVELQKIDNVSAGLSSVTVYMETRLE